MTDDNAGGGGKNCRFLDDVIFERPLIAIFPLFFLINGFRKC